MLQYVLWGISFATLWLTIVWLNYVYQPKQQKALKKFPKISLCIPCYNEAKTVAKTVKSLVELDYPKNKLEILVVSDGSTDGTSNVVRRLIKKHEGYNIKLFEKPNGGKASAVNVAIDNSTGEFFGCLDADSRVDPKSLKHLLPHFQDKKIGAVISRIKVDKPYNLYERMQRFEYIMSTLLRKVMSTLGTLSITPGVLSVYRLKTLRKIGGFVKDRENLTEDLEVAMRLKYHGYKAVMEHNSITYTLVPRRFRGIWRQRIRWTRGYIYNHWKYRSMFFNNKYGVYGFFQLPVNVVVAALLILNIGIISYSLLSDLWEFGVRSLTIKGYFINHVLSFPTLKELALGHNVQIMLPVYLVAGLSMCMIYIAHRQFKEHIRHHLWPIVAYTFCVPYFTTMNWIASIGHEVLRTKRKW